MPPPPGRRRWLRGTAAALLVATSGLLASTMVSFSASSRPRAATDVTTPLFGPVARVYDKIGYTALRDVRAEQARAGAATAARDKTLVIYVYHESQEHYVANLRFFVKVAIEESSSSSSSSSSAAAALVDYLVIVNGKSRMLGELKALAEQRTNVRVLPRPNACFDGGTVGEILRAHPELQRGYRYFVLINSSVRGPFLPRYWPWGRQPWTQALTALLSDDVKLVGTTVSCQTRIHVQSMVLATDQTGLGVLLDAGALNCTTSLRGAIDGYELAASAAILDAGYNLDCLLTRYRGVNWRQERERGTLCNAGRNPQVDRMNDGLPLDPFEVLFVKAKAAPHVPSIEAFLERYTGYYLDGGGPPPAREALEANGFLSPAVQQALQREKAELVAKAKRCGAVFDAAGYISLNPDLAAMTEEQAEAHFHEHGFFERRAYRFVVPSGGGGGTAKTAVARRRVEEKGDASEKEDVDCDFDVL